MTLSMLMGYVIPVIVMCMVLRVVWLVSQSASKRREVATQRERAEKKLEELKKQEDAFWYLLDEWEPMEGTALRDSLLESIANTQKEYAELGTFLGYTDPVAAVTRAIEENEDKTKKLEEQHAQKVKELEEKKRKLFRVGLCPTCGSDNKLRCGCQDVVQRTPVNGGPPIFPEETADTVKQNLSSVQDGEMQKILRGLVVEAVIHQTMKKYPKW